ncbi:hypothetical protein A5773_20050 [Mycobacterium sp. 852014-52450_SCH5900713]|uniref:hypothetical protein n=1 Tax=Mycobacterium sp. 852014-52450_SCH5900713 TaxID=1834116 RepID=UPI0007FD5BA6|nr:hypothetical protein [Mycobacterium sp. 852014-52450_SCH5900713]OBF93042.1 hypothetical protein A5773_20050 [Mycobacterium sp. 852014-52450_SCH5900713]
MTTTMTTADRWAVDYCPQCCPAGDKADRSVRLAAMTAPYAVTAGRGRWALCKYRCASCGHTWQRADLWTAKMVGLPAA